MKKFTLLSFMLTLLALAFGADLSMAAVAVGDNEPIEGIPSPDTKDLDTDLSGTPATEKTVKDSDINEDEIDELVVKFRPFNYTLSTDIETLARQKQVTDYTVKHPVMATPVMDCTNKLQISGGTTTYDATLVIGASSANVTFDEARMFGKSQTFIVKGVTGYKWDGTQNVAEGELMMKVVGRSHEGIKVVPINGYWNSSTNKFAIKDNITTSAKFQMLSTACHTAQLVVSPKNQTPVFVDANLQKKIMNTTIEKEWKKKKKNIAFYTDDIADNAMMTFREENERTKLVGAGGMRVENDEILGNLNCYFEEGVITQLLMKYVTNGTLTYADLVAMTRMQFGKWSASNEAEVYCSFGFIEQLLNLDFTKIAQTNVMATQTKYGVDVTQFKTSFGTLNFKICPILDEMGFENCAMIIDMKNAIHYWKRPNVSEKSREDLSKGGKEPVEADRDRYIKIDCFCLRGYNSILVGPSEKIFGVDTVYGNNTNIVVDDELSENPSDGDMIYLTADDGGFTAGTLVIYDASITSWKKYSGEITA